MRNWFKKTQKNSEVLISNPTPEIEIEESVPEPIQVSAWQKLKNGLKKTRNSLMFGFSGFLKIMLRLLKSIGKSLKRF